MSTWHTKDAYPGTEIVCTENGWMTSDVFFSWFVKFCETQTQRPLLLVYDGHSTHISYRLISKAREEQVTLLKLPAHTSDRLQPLDVCCFRPLKSKWDKAIANWTADNHARRITKPEFITLTGKCIVQLR